MLSEREPIDWAEILAFLEARAPGIGETIEGATPEQLEALAARSPVPLPECYVEFMRHFGGARGGFSVLAEHDYLAGEVLAIPEALYVWDRQRYLLIGMLDPSPRLEADELFLDLRRADAHDAPIVGFVPGGRSSVDRLECGVSDCVIGRALFRLGVERSEVHALILAGLAKGPDPAWVAARMQQTLDVLTQLGFARCLPCTPYTWGGQRGEQEFCLLQSDAEHEAVYVDVCGPERAPVAQVAAILEDHLGASLETLRVERP